MIAVPARGNHDAALIIELEAAAENAQTVHNLADDILNDDGTICLDSLEAYTLDQVRKELVRLRTIIQSNWETELLEATNAHMVLVVQTNIRARALVEAIQEALGQL